MSCCDHDHGSKYDLQVAVVMPEHVHLILVPLTNEERGEVYSLIEILKGIKGASVHSINKHLKRRGTVWQEESFDRVLRCSEKLDEKIGYVLQNPVRRGLVSDWQEYRWLWYQRPCHRYASPTVVGHELRNFVPPGG
jgi:REP element-mobilizing transposase RayT